MNQTYNRLSFHRLFADLSPLRDPEPDDGADRQHGRRIRFAITATGAEPFLEISPDALRTAGPHPADARLLGEIQRISATAAIYGKTSVKSSFGKTRLSLWDNPHLIHFFEPGMDIESPDGTPLRIAERAGSVILRISIDRSAPFSGETPQATLRLHVADAPDDGARTVYFIDETHVFYRDTLYTVPSVGGNYRHIDSLAAPVALPDLEAYLTMFLTFVDNISPELNGVPAHISDETEPCIPTLYLEKVAPDKALYLRTEASAGAHDCPLPSGTVPRYTVTTDGDAITLRRTSQCDISRQTDTLESMLRASARDKNQKKEIFRDGNFFIVPQETAGNFLLKRLLDATKIFRLVGKEHLSEYKVVAETPRIRLKQISGIDYMEGEGDIEIAGEHFPLAEILRQITENRYVQLSDGFRGIIEEEYVHRLQRLYHRRDRKGNLHVTLFDLPEVEELINAKLEGPFADRGRAIFEGFNRLKDNPPLPCRVEAVLRPYQEEGVKWLRYLYDNELGGCLADDMGLGKTLQMIALLSTIYPECPDPTLIVMPRSLLFNWEKELDRFAPGITHSTYYGPDRDLGASLKANVVLTTYGMARNDIDELKAIRFNCVVLDESQTIKNHSSRSALAATLLDSPHRFALSGTPMENNLSEIYSLFRFLNPTMFGSLDSFNRTYSQPIQKYGDKGASESLRRKLYPFILRRLKEDVLEELPERIDQTIYVEMSPRQKRLYEVRRLTYRRQLREAFTRESANKSQIMMFQAIGELRRVASVPESVSDGAVPSPKIDELMESLLGAVCNGHKSVVFFNFIAGLQIVARRLEKAGIGCECMTGETPVEKRKEITERFQTDPECKVLLLTLKVGGVGLNLTAADTVYIFEPWWNKAAEEQAVDRLHRMGQRHTVNTYSIITVGTIEERILQLQEQKSMLINELIGADTAFSKNLSEQEIDFILS